MRYQAPRALTSSTIVDTYMRHVKSRTIFWLFMEMTEEELKFVQDPYDGTPFSGILWALAENAHLTFLLDRVNKSDIEGFQSILSRCTGLEAFWIQIYRQIEKTGGNIPTYAPGELQTGIPPTDHVFGPAYRFDSLDDARLHTILWTSMSLFYTMFDRCKRFAIDHNLGTLPALVDLQDGTSREQQRAEFCAYQSARALPYCGQRGMSTEGLYYGSQALFGLSRVCTHTRNWEGFLWCDNSFKFLESLGNDAAARLREHLCNYWFETDKDTLHKSTFGRKNGPGRRGSQYVHIGM